MKWNTLAETVMGLADAVTAPPDSGMTVTEAEITVPLEVRVVRSSEGLVVFAQPGHSRWVSGFQPPTHPMRLRMTLESGDAR